MCLAYFRFSLIMSIFCLRCFAVEPTVPDVEYAQSGTRSLALDLYLPKPAEDSLVSFSPTVIWVHGGAWRAGSKKDVPVTRWLDAGFAIASVEYRLSPEATFPAQIHDIKAAIRFLRAHAQKYRLDANRFVVAGSSAGGHLAAFTCVSNGVQELEGAVGQDRAASSDVQAIVSFYGASNLRSILAQSTEHGLSVRIPALQLLLGGQPEEKSELARLASPVTHVDANDPPVWLIHGDADPQMPFAQAEELVASYSKYALPVQLDVVRGGKHGGKEFYEAARLDRIADELATALTH